METSLLKSLVNSITSLSELADCESLKGELVEEYHLKTEGMLKLLKPVIHPVCDSKIASDGIFEKEITALQQFVDELREIFENWQPLLSKINFVLQAELLMAKIRTHGLEILKLLKSSDIDLPSELSAASLELCIQKVKSVSSEQTSMLINKAINDHVEGYGISSETLGKISDSLSLMSNQDFLIEAVALEKLKESAELAEKIGKAEYIDQIISLVNHMHDMLVLMKQSHSCYQISIPPDFYCPLSLEIMIDPVIVASGQTYERAFIRKWIDLGLTVCPKTRNALAHTDLTPNCTVKALIASWCESNNVKRPDPVKSINLTKSILSLANAEYGVRRVNSLSTPYPSVISVVNHPILSSATHREGASPSNPHPFLDGPSAESSISRNHLDMESMSQENSEHKSVHSGNRRLNSGAVLLMSSSRNDTANADERSTQGHNQTKSGSTAHFNSIISKGTKLGGNEVSSGAYCTDASGELTADPQHATNCSSPLIEPDFHSRLDTGTNGQALFRRPSESFVPIVVSSPAIEMRADLVEVETEVKMLVELLKSSSIDSQVKATERIRLLAKHNMDNRIVIACCGAINLLVSLLYSTDLTVQENAVTALLNLSLNENNKTAIANADAIEPLIHVLKTGNCEARENAAATLFSLSLIEENRAKIGRSGAIIPLVDLLGNGAPRGKKDAATALFNLSINHENKTRIVQSDAVKYLVELMDPAFGMVDKAVAVLSNLATIHEGRMAIGEEQGIPVLVEVVELGSVRSKENAAAALLQLCFDSSRFCKMVLQEGAVPPLVVLSQSGTPRAREKAQQLLNFFRNKRYGNSRG